METNIEKFYDDSELVTFEDGLFGFEDKKQFLPLPVEEGNNDLLCLYSVEDENLSFVILNPFSIVENYEPQLSDEDFKKLGTTDIKDLSFFAICVINETPQNNTINLKCPIVVNAVTRKAVQIILQSDDYKMRHLLHELKTGEG